jgi:kynurenine formamidase
VFVKEQMMFLAGRGPVVKVHRGDEGSPVHRTLLSPETLIVEGLNLAAVEPGGYDLVCLPLKIRDGDGAPARACRGDVRTVLAAAGADLPGWR